MHVDESYAEYVAARWSMLHRLAVLLVGADPAEALTEEALVRAYLEWREIRESPSADDRVKEILAREAADERWAPEPDGTGLDVVPRRQRIAVVLRCFELWSDGEIATVVQCRADEVEPEVVAALARLGGSAADVTTELTRTADEAPVPVPRIESLLARGREARRRRVRRSLTWATSVSVVLLVGVAVGSTLQGSDPVRRPSRAPPTSVVMPERLGDLPAGAEPQVPYAVRSVLVLGSKRTTDLRTPPASITTTGNAVFVAYVDGVIERVDLTTLRTDTFTDRSQGEIVVDPTGRLVAWLERGTGMAQVHLRSIDPDDPPRDETRLIEGTPACCGNRYELNGITRSGEVVVSLPDANAAWVWDTRLGDVAKISGIGNGVVAQVAGDEVVVHHSPSYFAVGELRDGSVLVDQELDAEQADFADPLGERVVYADDGEVHVLLLEPYGRSHPVRDVRLGLPLLPSSYAGLRWEDRGHVLVDVSDASIPDGALVRCDVQSGACELTVRLDRPHLLAR